MDRFYQNLNIQFLLDKYFDDPERRRKISAGEILLEQDEYNDKLYLVLEGRLSGYLLNPDDSKFELYSVGKGMFVGVHSFFSGVYSSPVNVVAEEDSLVAFIDKNHPLVNNLENRDCTHEFMPVIIGELLYRQHLAHRIYLGREQALKELIHTEKMASLGQMAASIAHELNNSISVLKKNSEWLQDIFEEILKEKYKDKFKYFRKGLTEGRKMSSSEVRTISRQLSENFDIPPNTAKKLAQAGFTIKTLREVNYQNLKELGEVTKFWEMGSAFYDMKTASYHSSHVVRSIKQLGAKQARKEKIEINEAINESLILLKSNLRSVDLELRLKKLPLINGNLGEFVQIFSNLVKNGCESLIQSNTLNPLIEIFSNLSSENIIINIIDNGPGIPEDILPGIFQPNVTTKVAGLNFGLGIGLTIVDSLVKSYNGTVTVKSVPGRTDFELIFPVEN